MSKRKVSKKIEVKKEKVVLDPLVKKAFNKVKVDIDNVKVGIYIGYGMTVLATIVLGSLIIFT